MIATLANSLRNTLHDLDAATRFQAQQPSNRAPLYGQTYDSRPAAADRILDFSPKQGDRIDLSAVDANDQVLGDQAFQFIGQAQFTGRRPGPLLQAGGDTVVEVNTTTRRRARRCGSCSTRW